MSAQHFIEIPDWKWRPMFIDVHSIRSVKAPDYEGVGSLIIMNSGVVSSVLCPQFVMLEAGLLSEVEADRCRSGLYAAEALWP